MEKVILLRVGPDRSPGLLRVDTTVGLHVFGGEHPLAHIHNQPSSGQFNSSELS